MKRNNLQIILFGASGNLAALKLFPAFCEMFRQKQLPEHFQIIGYGRTKMTQTAFRKLFRQSVEDKQIASSDEVKRLLQRVFYVYGQYDEMVDFQKLERFCKKVGGGQKSDQVAYFSVPPFLFGEMVAKLADSLKKSANSFKIVLEKPFGLNGAAVDRLFVEIARLYAGKEVFLLDHFLGKRPIQSMLKLRLENNVVNMMIRGSEITKITIEALEKVEVGRRVGYYDQVGAIKDMVQSHLIQMLAMMTMDIPASVSLESLQREKHNIISAIRFSGKAEDVALGQYEGYRKCIGVARGSKTETWAELRLQIDRREWFHVPVIVRTGKKLPIDLTRAIIEFKKMPFQSAKAAPNQLIFEMKPGESLKLKLIQRATLNNHGKNPGRPARYETVELEQGLGCRVDFCLDDYAALINDVIRGDKTYFLSYAEVLAAWKVVDAVGATIVREKIVPKVYRAGEMGLGLEGAGNE